MKFEVKGNPNYVATVVVIQNKLELEGCDNICGTIIFGNHVIVSKDVQIGDIGLFFPVETKISSEFLSHNSLYRDKTLNRDKDKAGFFELNGRIRCMKLRGHKSEGFWIPINSLKGFQGCPDNFTIQSGIEFDHINDHKICEKYIVPIKTSSQSQGQKKKDIAKKFDKLILGQFNLHIDTNHLGKNIHKINPDDVISITAKLHGSSFVSSYILCNRKLTIRDKIARLFGVKVKETEYDYIYASRKVIKNRYLTKTEHTDYYKEDIWGTVHKELEPFLDKGMTIYGEVVGFLKSGGYIQKNYDYGCKPTEHKTYIYRITTTNEDGKVFEWSMLQIQQWCKQKSLLAVPLLYYGEAYDLYKQLYNKYYKGEYRNFENVKFLDLLQREYMEKKCSICENDVWAEGIVLRVESLDINPYKLKSFNFKAEESKQMDKGEINIEDNQE